VWKNAEKKLRTEPQGLLTEIISSENYYEEKAGLIRNNISEENQSTGLGRGQAEGDH